MGPELQKQIDQIVDAQIEDWKEQKDICELCNGTHYIKSNTIEYEGDCPECSVD